ncbi:glycosyltransferase family 2 protein [Chitinophaga sp. Mgbs1]|uniref:Glycosyltransferase family 2 protein n=1 Tax=Chitinophaga solisilvae TaxID=1233460 RepID=A0A9Q5D9X2_9BACT|nr:glycosyltransferase family 2 protein [Chitinophaga solisilvae]
MNRTMHLKKTLLQNIMDNRDYPQVEFVLLDYGSRDDLYPWARKELSSFINDGKLVYWRTTAPRHFHMSHSKNMVFRLATGDILCNIDADNFTGAGFAAYVNEMFNREPGIFLSPVGIGPGKKWWDVQGRICLRREDFLQFRGYDEKVLEYGYEDQDLKHRMITGGRRKMLIKPEPFLHAICHDDDIRIADGLAARKTKDMFIACADKASEIIYLQENNIAERFYVRKDLLRQQVSNEDCMPKYLYNGKYEMADNEIRLFRKNGEAWMQLYICPDGQLQSSDNRRFHRIEAGPLRENLLLQRAIYLGRKIFDLNKKSIHPVNPEGFGRGEVSKNFSEDIILTDC